MYLGATIFFCFLHQNLFLGHASNGLGLLMFLLDGADRINVIFYFIFANLVKPSVYHDCDL